jgi:hypothetical protein
MQYYAYNHDGIYIGIVFGQKNPMSHIEGEPEYLQPAQCVKEAPPSQEGMVAKLVDGAWQLIEDPAIVKAREEAEALAAQKAAQLAAEEAALQAQQAAIQAQQEKQAKIDSASAKLKALGLSDDEIKAMFGV